MFFPRLKCSTDIRLMYSISLLTNTMAGTRATVRQRSPYPYTPSYTSMSEKEGSSPGCSPETLATSLHQFLLVGQSSH